MGMPANERLGIEIQFNFEKNLEASISKIQDAFKKLNYLKIDLGINKRIGDEFKGTEKFFVEFPKQSGQSFNKSAEDVKKFKEQLAALHTQLSARKNAYNLLNLEGASTEIDKHQKKIADSVKKEIEDRNSANQRILRAFAAYKESKLKEEESLNQRSLRAFASYQESKDREEAAVNNRSLRSYARFLEAKQSMLDRHNRQIETARKMMYKDQADAAIGSGSASAWSASISSRMQNIVGVDNTKWASDIATQAKQADHFMQSLAKQGLRMVNGELVQITKSGKAMNDMFSKLTTRLIEFYSIRKVLFLISGEFQTAYRSVTDFNQALHDTAAIANASNSQMAKLSEAALQISTHSKFSAAQVMESMKMLAQSGVESKDIPEVARAADFFATGTGSTAQQASQVLTTAMNVWKIEAKDSTKITNILTAALNASKLEVGDLSTSFNYLANQSALFGKSIEETTALIATMANQGIKASTIGTSMSQFMTRLAAPTPKFNQLLKEYNIAAKDISPKTHTMVQIVKTFEDAVSRTGKKGVEVEHIFQALEARVGRGFATLVQAGSEKLELMEKRITNTNAAAVAWNESMKGFHAQLNVLRSELVTTINSLLSGLGESFRSIGTKMQDLLVGFRTGTGEMVVHATAMTTAIAALFWTLYSHPIIAAVSLTLGGVLFIIKEIGEAANKTAREIEASTTKMAENSAEYQRKADALYTILGLVDKNNLAEDGTVKVQEKSRKKIQELINLYPTFFKELDAKKLKYDDITSAIRRMNEERDKEIRRDVDSYNSNVLKTVQIRRELDDLEKERDKEYAEGTQDFFGNKGSALVNRKIKNKQIELQQAESAIKTQDASLAPNGEYGKYFNAGAGEYLYKKLTDKEKAEEKDSTKPEYVAPLSKTENGLTLEDKLEKDLDIFKKNLSDYSRKTTELEEKSKMDGLKATMKLDEKVLSDGNASFEDKLAASMRLRQKWVEYYEAEYQKDAAAAKRELLEKSGAYGLYEGNGEADKALKARLDALKKERDDKVSTIPKLGESLPDEGRVKITSDRLEKQADKVLFTRQQEITLRKEDAATAEEVLELTIKQTEAQLENSAAKKKAYEDNISSLEVWVSENNENNKYYKENVDALESLKDKHSAVVQLIKQQNAELARQKDNSFGGNFGRGVKKGSIGFGTTNERTEQLGADITSTLGDGLTSTIDNMITALGKGQDAWRSFREGLGGILKDIGDMLQKYIAKMIAVAIVQKIIGIASSFGGGADMGGAQFTPSPYETTVVGPAGFAGGGYVTGGVKGIDSVPAMLAPEEFVVKAESVRKYGVDFMNELNEGRVKRFSDGGSAGGAAATKEKAGSSEVGNLQIINLVDPNTIPQTSDAQIINVINLDIAKRGPTYKTIKFAQQGN